MRSVIKYISLLLFSGLIVPFYYVTFTQSPPIAVKLTPLISAQTQPNAGKPIGQAIMLDIAQNLFPVLKSLISL
ncbi:hypothetical protein [Mucilaginibacter ginsenosidivorax]|uniref:Uncharacterized protein n=1 Tax=Mucilaginibacter ginsenosidivorax TaxID=862126 RepID=A0A5B8W1L3_9SPHI|nr:hypothetical protein [Mucilaginibacter ginsenosidivorax]QEC76792.1 hypothetical protein FSB76_12860 [Mucilaginibacter ginsenosidivorax]